MNEANTLKWLKDRTDIKTTILRYATGADLKDWDMMQSIFADEVVMDFSAAGGGPADTVSPEEYIARVKALIPGFDSTQHQLTNFVIDIDGNIASAVAYMQAEHFVNTDEEQLCFSVGGYYSYKLQREGDTWKVNVLKLTLIWTRGDEKANEIAMQRCMNV